MNHSILITFDVEDWFHVENLKPWMKTSSWADQEMRVERNTHELLDLLDGVKANNHKPTATFFVLGWIAERLPRLVREIHERGHEVASHGYNHNLCGDLVCDELKNDLTNAKNLLEDIIGGPVLGYRAPNFSINNEVLKIIEDCGYQYDSSYNSFAMHGRYGHIDLFGKKKRGIAYQISNNFYEVPVSNLKIGRFVLPWGGGGYFRIIPFKIFKTGVQFIISDEKTYVFYMHPWEIDSDQPRIHEASAAVKFRHYSNLSKTRNKLKHLIESFITCNYYTCRQYVKVLGC